MPEDKKYYQISSLEKGIKILELLAEQKALTVTAVADRLGINRAGSHRFLATLRDLGYVEKDQDNRYQLTFRVLEMGMKVAQRFEIRREARSFMQELAAIFKETVNLGFWDGMDILHLDKIDSPEILRIDAPLWSKTPAYCTALGKAILAHLSEEELNHYLKTVRFVPHGPKTILSKKQLRKDLKETFERGFAMDDEELAHGLHCIAAPVFDHTAQTRYAMSISIPSMRLPRVGLENLAAKIREACLRLSMRLGYRPISADDMTGKKKEG
jgi:DNA-binding IclR family transcriptional regulator